VIGQEARPVLHFAGPDIRHHIARADCVDANPYRFECQCPRQLLQGAPRRGVGRDLREGEIGGIGSNIDDRAIKLHLQQWARFGPAARPPNNSFTKFEFNQAWLAES
jgi:hypothetical protein